MLEDVLTAGLRVDGGFRAPDQFRGKLHRLIRGRHQFRSGCVQTEDGLHRLVLARLFQLLHE
ncbi:MAG TPA: hypothetical protein VGQ46_08845 [Thermoanaerobaculia bacterium]|nr:hypothetical protein [Thermoanaerobaculia bacterium]